MSEYELEAVAEPSVARARPNWVRRLYDWTLHWSRTPYALWALFVLAFVESSFFPIPPDVLLIAMAMAAPKRSLRFALICTAGSVLGGCFGYAIGSTCFELIGQPVIRFYHVETEFARVSAGFQKNAFLLIFTAAFTPIPYKVFTIAGGVCHIGIPVLLAGSALGRGMRFFAVAGLFMFFGAPIKRFIDKYFNLLTVAFVIVGVLGVFAMKLIRTGEPAEPPGKVREVAPDPAGAGAGHAPKASEEQHPAAEP